MYFFYLKTKEQNRTKLSLFKLGANFNVDKNGLDFGVEGKAIRSQIEYERYEIGIGLNFDSGMRIGKDGVRVEVFGFGVSIGRDGFGIKLPVFDMKFKK